MGKVFEDYFSEIHANMVSVCLDYADKRAEKVFIYCVCESNVISCGFFFQVNGKVVKKHKLNDVIEPGQQQYDVSSDAQRRAIRSINKQILSLKKLCEENNREMPTQIKMIYDVGTQHFSADCKYNLFFSNDSKKTAYDVLEAWFESVKAKE